MSTIFCFAMPLDLNVVVNHFTELSIFVQEGRQLPIDKQVQNEIERMHTDYPQCGVKLMYINEVSPKKFGNPHDALPSNDFRVWVLLIQIYGISKTIWFISGCPRKAYSVMYPNFFRQPRSVVVDDLSEEKTSVGIWEEYVEHSNNNEHWSQPLSVERRSHQLIY